MTEITSDVKLQRNHEIIDSQIDDEVVMMDVDKGNYYGLNNIGAIIWGALETPKSIDELVSKLTKEYDISAEDCKNDIIPFVEQLAINNILKVGK